MENLLTDQEVMRIVGIKSNKTLLLLLRRGMPVVYVGKKARRYVREDLEGWFKEEMKKNSTELRL